MSKLLRCNRCGQEQELREIAREDNAITRTMGALSGMTEMRGWTQVKLGAFGFPVKPPVIHFDLCEDCHGVLVEQFMKGAKVEAITQPPGMNQLPHDNVPYQDCLLAFDPDQGRFVCEHDDPERFLWLQRNRAQNVAEGVPELQAQIGQLAEDVATAGVAHAAPQRCSPACSEMHTYVAGCLLAKVVTDVPGQIMPPTCGADCAPDLGSHTNVLGTCLNNPDTGRAIAVVCPVCKEEGSLGRLVQHMAEQHDLQPDYKNAQWVDPQGYNLEGRLISQQGEDLTEAYSPQEPAE
jgi:hypothetical protein